MSNGVVKNSVISLGGFVVAGALGYLFQFALARRLSVEQYGEFQSLVALFAILGVFSSALSYFVVAHTAVFAAAKDVAAHERFVRWLQRGILPAAGVLLAVFLALTPVVRASLHLSDSFGFIIVSVSALASVLTVLYQGALTGWEEFVVVYVGNVTGALLKLVAGFAIVWRFPRAAPAALALLVSAVGTWLVLYAWGNRRLRARATGAPGTGEDWKVRYFRNRVIERDLGFVALFTLLITLTQNLDLLLVKHLSTAELAGQYSALALAGKLIFWANLGVATVVLPVASARAHAGRQVGSRIRLTATGLMLGLGSVAVFLYALVPSLLLRVALGPPYTIYARELWLFGVMAFPLSLLLLEANFAFARRDPRVVVVLGSTAALMVGGIAVFHDGIRDMIVSVIAALAAGYVGTLLLNMRAALSVSRASTPQTRELVPASLESTVALPKY